MEKCEMKWVVKIFAFLVATSAEHTKHNTHTAQRLHWWCFCTSHRFSSPPGFCRARKLTFSFAFWITNSSHLPFPTLYERVAAGNIFWATNFLPSSSSFRNHSNFPFTLRLLSWIAHLSTLVFIPPYRQCRWSPRISFSNFVPICHPFSLPLFYIRCKLSPFFILRMGVSIIGPLSVRGRRMKHFKFHQGKVSSSSRSERVKCQF